MNLLLYSGVPKYQRRPRNRRHMYNDTIKDQFFQCEKGTFLYIYMGGGGLL